MKAIIKEHHVVGKLQMKQAAAVAMQVKNDSLRRGGFSPSQWLLGKHPRRPGSRAEEDEWGQLGVLKAQQKSDTYAAAMLRKAKPINRDYQQGDW
eukprot:6104560-Heterocapsa_arctica.AAC.1